MTFGRASALVLSLLGAVALGVWIGPHVTKRGATETNVAQTQINQSPAAPSDVPVSPAAKQRATARRAPAAKATAPRGTPGVISFTPEVQKRVQPLLNKGADMTLASDGFPSAEQFATVAHAARNTEIPFMVLKHRVLDEKQTLAAAIEASKPELNSSKEANRAREQAKADFADAAADIAATAGQ
jgi:hypothetical protein